MAYGNGKTQVTFGCNDKDLKAVNRLKKKLGARSRNEVLALAVTYGLDRIEDLLGWKEAYQDYKRSHGDDDLLPPGAMQLDFLEAFEHQVEIQNRSPE